MRRSISSRIAFNFRTKRVACVFRLTTNLFFGLAAVVREAQKVEGLRASLPGGRTVAGGKPPELDQPGLALVERQAELLQPVLEVREELLPIYLVLTAEYHIVRVPADDHLPDCPTPSPLVNPEVDDVVEERIGEDRADPRPLRRARLHRSPLAALEDAGLEPSLDQAKHPRVGDPVRQHPHQPSVVDGIEEGADIDIEHEVHALRHQGLVQSIQGRVRAPLRPKAVAEPEKVGLVEAFSTSATAPWTILSSSVGMPSGRRLPSAFGM